MKKTFCLAGMLLLLVTSLAFAAQGSAPAAGSAGKGNRAAQAKWWEVPALAKALSLTESEQQKLGEMFADSQKQVIDLRPALQKTQLELDEFVRGDKYSAKGAVDRYRKLQKIQNEIALEQFLYQAKLRELLGQERYQKVLRMAHEARTQQQKAQREAQEKSRQGQAPPPPKP